LQTIPADALVEINATALTPVKAANVIAVSNFILTSFIVCGSKQTRAVGNASKFGAADVNPKTLCERKVYRSSLLSHPRIGRNLMQGRDGIYSRRCG
jgi:hypothetical protein